MIVATFLLLISLFFSLNWSYKIKKKKYFQRCNLPSYEATFWEAAQCLKLGLENFVEGSYIEMKSNTFAFATPTGCYVATRDPVLVSKVLSSCHSKMSNFEYSAFSVAPGMVSRKREDPKYIATHAALTRLFVQKKIYELVGAIFSNAKFALMQLENKYSKIPVTEEAFGLLTASILSNVYFGYDLKAFELDFEKTNYAINKVRETIYERTGEIHWMARFLHPFKAVEYLRAKRLLWHLALDIYNAVTQDNISTCLKSLEEQKIVSNKEALDEIINFILVGTDTVTKGFIGVLTELSDKDNEHCNTKLKYLLQNKIANPQDILNLDYFDWYIKEVLRKHPVVMLVHRNTDTPINFNEFTIPKNMDFFAFTKHLHFHPGFWQNPNIFDPTRWESGQVQPGTYLPFGGGNRLCIGKNFAIAQLKIVCFMIIRHFDIHTEKEKGTFLQMTSSISDFV